MKKTITKIAILSFLVLFMSACNQDASVKMEVINGIEVPPEPDPVKNNATLEGVDVNTNGVRDDVERIAAKDSQYKAEIDNPIILEYQKIINYQSISIDEVSKSFLKILCFYHKNPNALDLENKILNTDERVRAYDTAQAESLSNSLYPVVIDDQKCEGQ